MEMGLNCGTGFSVFKSIAIKLESGSRFLRTRTGTGAFDKKDVWVSLTHAGPYSDKACTSGFTLH
jgi:hypothetical protein